MERQASYVLRMHAKDVFLGTQQSSVLFRQLLKRKGAQTFWSLEPDSGFGVQGLQGAH